MIEKLFSVLWDGITPQKNLDKHCDKLVKAKISQKTRDELMAEVTRAKIQYGKWEFALFTLVIIFVGVIYLVKLFL